MPKASISRLPSIIFTIRVGGFLVAALAMWLFAKIANEVLEKQTQAFDQSILLALRRLHTPLLNQVTSGVTSVGEPSVLLIVALSLGIWLLLKRRRPEAITVGVAAVGALGLNYWIKELFRRVLH